MLASVDGAIGPAEEARIPVTDEGLTRGDGGFEVLRLYGGRPFAQAEHLARLDNTCAGLRLPYDDEALRAEIAALVTAAGPARRAPARGPHARRQADPDRRAAARAAGDARVATVTYAPTRVLDGLKTLSYAGEHAGRRGSRASGAPTRRCS